MNKFVKITAATGLALTLGVATLAPTVTHAASVKGEVVHQDASKTITQFSKADLQALTGTSVTLVNVNTVYNKLTKTNTWVKAGYSKAKAGEIAKRVSAYTYQLKGILRDIAQNQVKGLQVTYVSNVWTTQINFGTYTAADNSADDSVVPVPVPEPDNGDEDSNDDYTPAPAPTSKLAVKELDIDIDYNHKDVEIEYEVKNDGRIKAKYKNEYTGQKMEGVRAQKVIENLFAGFNMHSKNKNQIVNHVLGQLNLSKNFKKFQYEVEFPNRAEFEFKIK